MRKVLPPCRIFSWDRNSVYFLFFYSFKNIYISLFQTEWESSRWLIPVKYKTKKNVKNRNLLQKKKEQSSNSISQNPGTETAFPVDLHPAETIVTINLCNSSFLFVPQCHTKSDWHSPGALSWHQEEANCVQQSLAHESTNNFTLVLT